MTRSSHDQPGDVEHAPGMATPSIPTVVIADDDPGVRNALGELIVAHPALTLVGTAVFAVAWVITIPLSVIPGFSLLVPLLLMAWLHPRTFAYDAVSMHVASTPPWT